MPRSRNPGFEAGNHWNTCDVCGFNYRQSSMRRRWDGAVVCTHDWEMRHPQDFVRAVNDDQSAKGLVRSEPADVYIGDSLNDFGGAIFNRYVFSDGELNSVE